MTPKRSVIPVFVPHLGCPCACVFCDQRRVTGESVPVTGAGVVAALEEGLRRTGDRDTELAFYGGSFTAIPAARQEELLAAAQPFVESGRLSGLRISTRPDCVDEGTLQRLRSYHVRTVELGVQSMDPEVLRLSGRGHTAEDAVRAAKLVKDFGFTLILQMMTGLPGDTLERSLETADRLIALRPDGVRIYPTVILRGTALFELWKAGSYREHTVEEAVRWGAELWERFEAADVPVIRFGLNPSEDLSQGEAVGGAYHPALGELVLNRRYLLAMEKLLGDGGRGQDVTFLVEKGRISAAVGQKRRNAAALTERFGVRRVKFTEGFLPEGELVRIVPEK